MSGPMSLREARTKQQKEKSYKNSRLRFRASMKPTRNERSPSEHGDEKSTRKKKIMKVDNTEGEASDPNMGGSGTEELKIAVSSAGDVDMSGGSGEIVEREGTSADPDVKDTGDTESDNMSIEKALEIVCGEAEAEDKLPATEDESSEDYFMPDVASKDETSIFTDENISKKNEEAGDGAEDTSEKKSKQGEGAGNDMPLFKDEEDEKKGKSDKKNKRSRKDDDDSDEDNSEDGKNAEKGKKKDKDSDGSGGSGKPDGGDGNNKDDDASGGDKPAGGGDSKDGDGENKDEGDQKEENDGQNSDDDFEMGGNGEGDKNLSDDDPEDLGESSEDEASDNEISELEETEDSLEDESDLGITDDEESEAESATGNGIGKLNVTEEGIGGIVFDGGEDGRGLEDQDEMKPATEEVEKVNEREVRIQIGPFDVESDIESDDDITFDEDFCQYLSGGSGCDDDYSYGDYGDDDYLEDAEEVRGTG